MSVKVLILEDNPVARSFLCKVVRESFSDALQIVEVADLESARREVRTHGMDPLNGIKLMLVDLELPDGNGMELLSELMGSAPLKVVTTLYSDDEHLFPALQCGADGYLLKEELQRIVRGQPPLSPASARRLLGHFRPVSHDTSTAGLNSNFGVLGATSLNSRPVPLDPTSGETARLSPRENEVLTYLSKGFTIKEIANLMGIKWYTVNDHIKSIYKKLNVSSRAEAAVLASKQGLV